MNTSKSLLRLGAALCTLTLAGALRADDDTTTSSIKFSDSSKPGTVKLVLPWADVRVVGTDGNEVVVTSSLNDKHKNETRKDGLRRLDDEVSFELHEDHNIVTVAIVGDNAWAAHGSDFSIKVPRNANLVVRTEAGGDILVEKVEGDLDINSMNGEVTLRDIASSAVVNTMNGEIHATFKMAPVKPISFSTMNGEISLFLPKDTKANLRMRTQNGSLLTDFGADLLKTKNDNRVKVAGEEESATPRPQRDAELAQRDAERAKRDAKIAARAATAATPVAAVNPVPAVAPVPAEAPEAPEAAGEHDDSEFKRESRREIQNAMRSVRDATRNIGRTIGRSFRPEGHGPGFSVGGKSVSGTLNGGGIDISLASMNGTVTVRQVK